MNVLLPQKFYHRKGGDGVYTLRLQRLLESRGHRVIPFSMRDPESLPSDYTQYWVSAIDFNEALSKRRLTDAARVSLRSVLSYEAWSSLRRLLDNEPVDVAHLQNIHNHLTPSILYALERRRVPVVWTLHDFVILCPATHFLSHGSICEACKSVRYDQAVRKRCKKNSLAASLLAATSHSVHRLLRVYRFVNRFIAPSRFLKNKFVEFGFPSEKILHIPHFLDCAKITPNPQAGDYFLYVGRLSREKGVDILLRAARLQPKLEVRIVGDGPDQDELEKEFAAVAGVRFLGRLHGRELDEAYAKARAVVLPSLWYENHPLIVLEAYAHGKPVIASRLGALQEVIRDDETGLLFRPGDEKGLVSALERLIRDPDLGSRLGREGRRWLEKDNSPDLHYRRIMSAYDEASRAARPEKLHSD